MEVFNRLRSLGLRWFLVDLLVGSRTVVINARIRGGTLVMSGSQSLVLRTWFENCDQAVLFED